MLKYRNFQFSLLTLLIATTFLCIVFSCLYHFVFKLTDVERAVKVLHDLGANTWETPLFAKMPEEGDSRETTWAIMVGPNADLTHLDRLIWAIGIFPQVEVVFDTHKLTNNELCSLKLLTNIRAIGIYNAAIDDIGMTFLGEMKSLQVVGLGHVQISEKGLRELSGLNNLRQLQISGINVSKASVLQLFTLCPELQHIELNNEGLIRDYTYGGLR